MEDTYIFEELSKYDCNYLNFIFQFTNYHYETNKDKFENYLVNMKQNNLGRIILLKKQKTDEIIGAGTILILHKIHNNPIGEIHDVFVDKQCRNLGLGKKIIEHLTNIGLNEYLCYKIILNCLEHNVSFYEKCNFKRVGNEMKYCKKEKIMLKKFT